MQKAILRNTDWTITYVLKDDWGNNSSVVYSHTFRVNDYVAPAFVSAWSDTQMYTTVPWTFTLPEITTGSVGYAKIDIVFIGNAAYSGAFSYTRTLESATPNIYEALRNGGSFREYYSWITNVPAYEFTITYDGSVAIPADT